MSGKGRDTVITNGSHILVHGNFGGHSKAPELGSMAELHKLAVLLDQLRGNYMVFLYLICSTKVVCEDREEVLGKNSKDIVSKLKYYFLPFAKILHSAYRLK